MKAIRGILNTAMATIGGALAGGAAGGAMFVLVATFPNFSHAKSLAAAALGFALYLSGVVAGALFGSMIGGLIFGLIPTFLLGLLLTRLSRWPPFDRLLVWIVAGALTGVAICLRVPAIRPTVAMSSAGQAGWLAAWAIGGAAAMGVYWAAAAGYSRINDKVTLERPVS